MNVSATLDDHLTDTRASAGGWSASSERYQQRCSAGAASGKMERLQREIPTAARSG